VPLARYPYNDGACFTSPRPLSIEPLDLVFLVITAFIAWHGITYRDAEGETDMVRLLFGCIALLFFMRVLFVDVLEVF